MIARGRFLLAVLAVLLALAAPLQARAESLDCAAFARLPVQHDGRIKPLDTFARGYLAAFSGRAAVDGMGPCPWLAELLFDQNRAYARRAFDIPSPAVRDALSLPDRADHRYTFPELADAFDRISGTVQALLDAPRDSLDPAQARLADLYTSMLWYLEISRSLSMVLPAFEVRDKSSARAMGIAPGRPFSYLELLPRRAAYLRLVRPLLGKDMKDGGKAMSPRGMELLALGVSMRQMEADRGARIFRVVPPQWKEDGDAWLSPWAVLQDGRGSPASSAQLSAWSDAARAYAARDEKAWAASVAELSRLTKGSADGARLDVEYGYNYSHVFAASFALYTLALIAFACGRKPERAAFILLASGWVLHLAGIAARVYIMGRPPVATLYESILFVGLVVAAFCMFLYRRTRDRQALATGALAAAALQFLGLRYGASGDTMGTLTAVLNTNFWLATHVVVITAGYGACIVAGLLGHARLARGALFQDDANGSGAMTGATLAALLLATAGTILGGIWADQSWGRFWGWDPKENGALLIVLWLLWLLHAGLSGLLRPPALAAGTALTLPVVAVSWFGVNLLNVGLHSYGFTSDIAVNLALFVASDLLLVGCLYLAARKRAGRCA